MTYTVNEINKLEDFRDLNDTWSDLIDNAPYRPFLDYDWFDLWLRHFKDQHQLFTLVVKDHAGPKAICPFLLKKDKLKVIPIEKIELIGNIYSPVRNIIFTKLEKEEKEKALSILFRFLSNLNNWDLIDLSALPEEDFDFDMLHRVLQEIGLRKIEYFCFGNWYLDNIAYSGEDYLRQRPKVIRKDVPYCQRRLQKMGNLEFKLVSSDDGIDHYMNMYYDVYSKSWQQSEDVGPSFHRDLAKLASRKNILRLGFLLLNKIPISSQFWIVCDNIAYILKTAYDQNYNKFSPGKILTMLMIKHAIDVDKVTQLDFLHGDDPYKKNWFPNRRERKGVLIINNTLKAKSLYFFMFKVLPAIERFALLKAIKQKTIRLFKTSSIQQ